MKQYYVKWSLPSGIERKTGPMSSGDAHLIQALLIWNVGFDDVEVLEYTS